MTIDRAKTNAVVGVNLLAAGGAATGASPAAGLSSTRQPTVPWLILTAWTLAVIPAAGQQQVVPPPPIFITAPQVTINNSPGDQTDPHVSKDLTAYTDVPSSTVRYYRFSTGVGAAIPQGPGALIDVLPGVSGNLIAFARIEADRNAIFVFDTQTSTLTEIDPHPGSNRLVSSIGGNTVAFIDQTTGSQNLYAYDLGASPLEPPQIVSASPFFQQNPNVAPDGNTIVWEQCQTSIVNCDVFKAVRAGGAWTMSPVANSPDPEGNPDTDGTWIVYDANLPGNATGQDIYFQPLAGGPVTNLAMPGAQMNPSISRGIITFESKVADTSASDIFAYDIANNILYQLTSTPLVNDQLNNVSVLDNGDIRVVWAADDGLGGEQNIYSMTFTPLAPSAFVQVSAGAVHTCAVRANGMVECWGNNAAGQVPGTRAASAGIFTAVTAGSAHTCGLTDAGAVECWGNNSLGQAPAHRAAHSGVFTEVTAGTVHTCALRSDGVIECWGSNILGEAPATRSAKNGAFLHVAAGSVHSCAVRTDGVVECWGNNIAGQAPATRTGVVGGFLTVTAGTLHTCAVARSGANEDVECWGNNLAGQAPASRPGIFGSVSAGGAHTCGIEGSLSALLQILNCWGDDHYGQAPSVRYPAAGGGTRFVQVSAGGFHTCAINQGPFVECWGENHDGQAPAERH